MIKTRLVAKQIVKKKGKNDSEIKLEMHIFCLTWLVIKKFLKAIFLYDEGST